MRKKSGIIGSKTLWLGFVAVAAVLGVTLSPGKWFGRAENAAIQGAPVRRGPLRISVLQRGELAARNSVSVKSEIEGQTTILQLVREGTTVQPGDLLVRLDAADLVERELQQRIAADNSDASYKKAKAQYDIQVSQNKSDIETAERKLRFAELDLTKFKEGDSEQDLKKAQDDILLARQKRTQAETTLTWSKSLHEKGFLTQTELDRDDLEYQSADVQLQQAVLALELLQKYEDPRKLTELEADLAEAKRGLDRAHLQADARIADYEAALKTSEARLKLESEKLVKYQDQLQKTRITSTVTGMVVYTRTEGGRMGSGESVQEGTQVREGQEILTIPSTGGMIAQASIHETVLKQVAPDLPCTIRVDAAPGKELHGKVQFVALLPDKGNFWANPNQRLYRTEVSIDDALPDIRPGMNCSIEILVEEIPDTLYVPLQSIVLAKGETVAFVVGGSKTEQRPVKVGKQSDKWVQVLEGLSDGEIVLLAPPAWFAPEQGSGESNGESAGPGAEKRAPGRDGSSPAGALATDAARGGDPSAMPQESRSGLGGPPGGGSGPGRSGRRRGGDGARPTEARPGESGGDARSAGGDARAGAEKPAPQPPASGAQGSGGR